MRMEEPKTEVIEISDVIATSQQATTTDCQGTNASMNTRCGSGAQAFGCGANGSYYTGTNNS